MYMQQGLNREGEREGGWEGGRERGREGGRERERGKKGKEDRKEEYRVQCIHALISTFSNVISGATARESDVGNGLPY